MEKRKLYLIALGAAAAAAATLVTVSILSTRGGGSTSATTAAITPPSVAGAADTRLLFAGIPQRGTVLGTRNAPVTLVEYADPQCPYCAQWARVALPEIVNDYVRTGRVRIEYRGLAFIGPDSRTALGAALGAGRHGKLWQVVHLLYTNQATENSGWINEGFLGAVASSVGITEGEFSVDRYSPAVERAIQRSQTLAESDGVTGTPSFFAGRTGGRLQPVQISSLDAGSLRPVLDRLLGA